MTTLEFNLIEGSLKALLASTLKVVHEQSGKVEYERERLLGIALKIH
jgi:hypothetical protein